MIVKEYLQKLKVTSWK